MFLCSKKLMEIKNSNVLCELMVILSTFLHARFYSVYLSLYCLSLKDFNPYLKLCLTSIFVVKY